MNAILSMIFRVILGLILLIFGANKFFHFIPMDPPVPGSFMEALFLTGYMFPLIAITEIGVGLLLLLNKWVGFALVWLAPISVNIILFHITFDISTIGPAALVALLNIVLFYANWYKFKTLF